MNIIEIDILVKKYRDEDLMEFSGKLVEPTKLEKITLRQAAISFNKDKKNAKNKTKRKEIVSVTEVSKKKDCCGCKLKNCSYGNFNCKKNGNHCSSDCTCNK